MFAVRNIFFVNRGFFNLFINEYHSAFLLPINVLVKSKLEAVTEKMDLKIYNFLQYTFYSLCVVFKRYASSTNEYYYVNKHEECI